MNTPDMPPLPEPRLWYDPETQQCSSMVPLRPTYEPQWDEDDMCSYGDARAAAAVLAERERLSSPEAVAEAAMLLGAFSADENASAKALFDAARTMFGAETVAAVLTKYKSKERP